MTIPHPLWKFPENSSDLVQPPFPKLDSEGTQDKHKQIILLIEK